MKVQGNNCSITIKTTNLIFDVPYSEETIREAVSVLQEEAAIEGDGQCKAIIKKNGVTGCVVTPLTLNTVPFLLYLAFGFAEKPLFVSGTRNTYSSKLNLLPLEDTDYFDLIQFRGNDKRIFENCRIQGFELRIENKEPIKLKLDVCGEKSAKTYFNNDEVEKTKDEHFKSDKVFYWINDKTDFFIYGITLNVKKESGTKTEIWIRRILQVGYDMPEKIDELLITALLLRTGFEYGNYGLFSIRLKNLVMVSDETNINSSDTVIDPIRYFVTGDVSASVLINNRDIIA